MSPLRSPARRQLPEHEFHKRVEAVLEGLHDQFEALLEESPAITDFEVSLAVCAPSLLGPPPPLSFRGRMACSQSTCTVRVLACLGIS